MISGMCTFHSLLFWNSEIAQSILFWVSNLLLDVKRCILKGVSFKEILKNICLISKLLLQLMPYHVPSFNEICQPVSKLTTKGKREWEE